MRFSLLTMLLTLAAGVSARRVPHNSSFPSSPSSSSWWGGPRPYGSSTSPSSSGGGGSHQHPDGACLNATSVDALVAGYTYLLEQPGGADFNSTAEAILSDRFVVWSDSILTLSNRTLGQPAYPSKQVYIATQFQTPPLPTVQTLGVFATCDQISWRWLARGIGSDAFEIKGIIAFDVDAVAVQIDTVYSEFNTAAFEADLGV